jgi:hypothetical protein
MPDWKSRTISRRTALGAAALGAVGATLARTAAAQEHDGHAGTAEASLHGAHLGDNRLVGTVDHEANGFDPATVLTDFDYGETSIGPDGRTIREWVVTAIEKEIEIASCVMYPAWT